MSLKLRLAFLYSLSVFIILLISALSIFLFNENFRKDEFTKRLLLEASESAELFFSATQPNKSIIDDLNQNAANSGDQEKIFIFDSLYNLLFSTQNTVLPPISATAFNRSHKSHAYTFTNKGTECVLVFRIQGGTSIYVLASGFDVYGRRKSDNLKVLLSSSVLGGLLLSGFLAFFYVRQAMKPLEKLKTQIEKINERNLKERIIVRSRNNEVDQIAEKFNAMLDRLEHTFEQRKNFVQHASHELRTPLANMLAQTESALNKSMTEESFRDVLISLKEDQQDLIDLTNSLLTLSGYEKITSFTDGTVIRIDDVLYEAIDLAKQMSPEAMVTVDFKTVPENENELEFSGNPSLIRSAISNLIKNGISYSSDMHVKVCILTEKASIILHFDNNGKQLSSEEQGKLFIPFFRGENSGNKKGFGLGLSIVQRILHIHNGTVIYTAMENNINRFTIKLPSNRK